MWALRLAGQSGTLRYEAVALWKVTLGGELPYGAETGHFGALHAARRVSVALRRSW